MPYPIFPMFMVIIKTSYPGQAPQVVEDQVTYPLTTAMLAVPGVRKLYVVIPSLGILMSILSLTIIPISIGLVHEYWNI